MNKIRVLPEILANKIAAGEIVERPASVVKELIENSLDAGSRTIQVTVLAGGKRLIQVCDDGEGMSQDDAILAFEHHATSKIRDAEDLRAIATLGFRGEALPSIASVSHLTMKTRHRHSEEIQGIEIEVRGGVMRSVKPASWDKGTEVTVHNLFFNIPARRKFLRSADTELGHIARLVTHYALAHPEAHFSLEGDGRSLMNTAAVNTLRERIYQLFGEAFLDKLLTLSGRTGSLRASGFSSRPQEQRANTHSQFLYVNRRMVRDKVITGAIREAYRTCIPASAHPVVILFLELPFDEVDVNAHPSKIEIRFRDQRCVHNLVLEMIQRALAQNATVPAYTHRPETSTVADYPTQSSSLLTNERTHSQINETFDFTPIAASTDLLKRALNYPFRDIATAPAAKLADHMSLKILPELLFSSPKKADRPFRSETMRILGQFQESYIIACDSQGLLIIDQHVMHERILYEKLAATMKSSAVESQGLLVPISLELVPHQMALFERVEPEFQRSGFHVEAFGGNSILIRSVPAIARESDCEQLLLEILEGLETEERTLDLDRIRERIAVNTACRSAIKIHTPLSPEKMRWLVDELALTRIPTHCPHGRPIILRFSTHEIERNFGRL